MTGALLTVGTVLWCLLLRLEAQQRRPTAAKSVKSTFTLSETTSVSEFRDFDIRNANTERDNAAIFPDRAIGHFISQLTAADGQTKKDELFPGIFGMPAESSLRSETVRDGQTAVSATGEILKV